MQNLRFRHGYVVPTLAVLSAGLCGCNSPKWGSSLTHGVEKSAEKRQPVLVFFHSMFDKESRELDKLFGDDDLEKALELFVLVRLDHGANKKRAESFGIRDAPGLVVIRPDGSVAGVHLGKMTKDQLTVFLVKYRYY